MEFDEPQLPLLCTSSSASKSPTLPALQPPFRLENVPATRRKRNHYQYNLSSDPSSSSDPALFSSDDINPSAENYACKRRKERWTGTWWGQRVTPSPKSKILRKMSSNKRISPMMPKASRQFKRNFDSGVFMGSDSTDSDKDSEVDLSSEDLEEELLQDQMKQNTKSSFNFETLLDCKSSPPVRRTIKANDVQAVSDGGFNYALCLIQTCLDDGEDQVDLSALQLRNIPAAIRDLRTLTKHSQIRDGLPLDTGAPIEAELKLFASSNRLSALPHALFELENLSALSLRNNKLANIPWSIRNLHNLRSLNISTNMLQYLPFEILELLRDHKLANFLYNANLWSPVPSDLFDRLFVRRSLHSGRIECKSKVNHVFRVGRIRAPSSENGLPGKPHERQMSHCSPPSLTELILRQLSRFHQPFEKPEADVFSPLMPPDTSPVVLSLLSTLHENQALGQRQCTFCHHNIITPRETWIEWWCILAEDDAFWTSFMKDDDEQDRLSDADHRKLMRDMYRANVVPFERSWCGSCLVPEGFWIERDGDKVLYTEADIGAGKMINHWEPSVR